MAATLTRAVLVFPLVATLLAAAPAVAQTKTPPRAAAKRLFAEKVFPLLKARCFACHGDDPDDIRGKYVMHSRGALLKGGKQGTAVVPGRPERSRLLRAVAWREESFRMPPKENDRLSAEQVEWIRRWIAADAPWPAKDDPAWRAAARASGVTVKTSGGQTAEWTQRRYRPEDLWAYRPLADVDVPEVADAEPANPIDAFLARAQRPLAAAGLTPAPPADRRTLIRRVTLDLTGLSPTPAELRAFLDDHSVSAWERLVDRLLASPAHGERWGQHWLDVVRYADTSGFSNDYERPNAWRYRDWVVRSLNADLPYDQFLERQLAGDEIDRSDPDCLLAVGFLRMGPWEHTGMSVAAVTRQQYLDDVTHSVGVTFLAAGLRCARCHDHKFDPVPTRDYYRLQAVFAPVQFADRRVEYREFENTSSFASTRSRTKRVNQAARVEKQVLTDKSNRAIRKYLDDRGVKRWEDLPVSQRPRRRFYGLDTLDRSLDKILSKRIAYYVREMKRYQPLAFSVYAGPLPDLNIYNRKPINRMPPVARRQGPAQAVHVLKGGSLEAVGERVGPGVLSAIASARAEIPATVAGRRLALARWMTDPANPLPARVIVNRLWQHHFAGRGLVETPNDFGRMGGRPSHPELLDWLAKRLIAGGWSLKSLHRLIVTTAVYRQSSAHPQRERLEQIDANNRLLARFPTRRLTAEEIRDGMLAASGELNREMSGPGVYPEIHPEVAMQPRHIMGSVAPAYQPSPTPALRNRRTLYVFRYRTLRDPLLEVLNRPGSETSCAVRESTTVTTQALTLFNGQFVHDRALALANRVARQHADPRRQLDLVFELLFGRRPSKRERWLCLDHRARMLDHHQRHRPVPVRPRTSVERVMIEEMTGVAFHWTEELDIQQNYVRDLKPWDVGPPTRALAEVCLVLFNSNEFVHVR